jgi:DNA-binding MarR family transcriptional regulator
MSNLYIRFLNTLDALGRANPSRALDSTEIQLLEHILLAADKGQTILVGDLIHLSQLGSQATLHGRIKNLIVLGYVKLVADKVDGRKKSAVPTKLAQKYVQFLSDCIEASLKKS